MLCKKLFMKIFYDIYGAIITYYTSLFRILSKIYFRTRPQEKVVLATPRIANWRIKFHSDIKLNCRIKYLKYLKHVVIALTLYWCCIHLDTINLQIRDDTHMASMKIVPSMSKILPPPWPWMSNFSQTPPPQF